MFQFTHPVWGATRKIIARWAPPKEFQFTHPVWGATKYHSQTKIKHRFQFTHPVWGATQETHQHQLKEECFNSRTPCGVRLTVQ